MNTIIHNVRLVDAVTDTLGAIFIKNEKIASVVTGSAHSERSLRSLFLQQESSADIQIINGNGLVLMPAFVDMHAHFRYPGQSEKEELVSALRAAAAGGFGTLVLMANTNPIVSTVELANSIQEEAEAFGLASVIQTLSITKDFHGIDTSHLDSLTREDHPIVSEDGRDVESSAVMLEAMEKCSKNKIIMSCHCEDTYLAMTAKKYRQEILALLKDTPDTSLALIPKRDRLVPEMIQTRLDNVQRLLAIAEDIATTRNLALAGSTGCPIHIAHVSTRKSLQAIREAKEIFGSMVSCEVTPHHLSLTSILPEFVNPPLRSEEDRQALIRGIEEGTIDMIATDHAPHSMIDKMAGAPGFSGLETAFAICYSVLVETNTISLSKLSELMSANPARRLGIKTGLLRPDYEANIILVQPGKQWIVNPELFYSKGKNSPYRGEKVSGKVISTFYKGKLVFNNGFK